MAAARVGRSGQGSCTYATVRRARAEDRASVERLLESAKLPTAGVGDQFTTFFVAVSASGVVGAVGLERYGDNALLRSCVVAEASRGRGIGVLLTMRVLEDGLSKGVKRVYVVTTDAMTYFEKLGFKVVPREQALADVGESAEFKGGCPETATCMTRELKRPTGVV
jgi:N-acetylglutamate synthase-like GNAT family acetyltransferase